MSKEPALLAYQRAVQALAALPAAHQLPLDDCAFALSTLPELPQLSPLRARLAKQLQEHLCSSWVLHGNMQQVFAVLGALWHYKPTCVAGTHLAAAVQRLIVSEVATGGPYRDGSELPLAANTYIAHFMQTVAEPLPNVQAFLTGALTAPCSAEPSMPYLLYLLSKSGNIPALNAHIRDCQKMPEWQTPMRLAVGLTILQNQLSGNQITQILQQICQRQQPGGLWHDTPCAQQADTNHASIAPTALIIATLQQCLQPRPKTLPSQLLAKRDSIAKKTRQLFSVHTEPLATMANALITDICSADKNMEITLFARQFGRALRTKTQLTSQQYTALGIANLCGWMAYTIYDDLADCESNLLQLPLANIATRHSLAYFKKALPGQPDFQQQVAAAFTAMDETTAWELTNCRLATETGTVLIANLPQYDDYSALANRSLAHTLTPLAVAMQCSPSRVAYRYIKTALHHYLIARQLTDDLRDWQKDIRAGHASAVVTAILQDMHVQPGTHSIAVLLPAMQQQFAQHTLHKLCRRILWHIQASREHLAKSRLLLPGNFLYTLLNGLEACAISSREACTQTTSFCEGLASYDW